MKIVNRRIIDVVKGLDLTAGEYAVFGSALMEVYGMRESGDVDLIVTRKLFEELAGREEWERFVYENNGDEALKYQGDFVDVAFYYCNYFGADEQEVERMIKRAETIEGVSFVSLEDTMGWKRKMGREKDVRDVGMIEKYMGEEGCVNERLFMKFGDGVEANLKDKRAVRVVVEDGEGKVALLYVEQHGYYKIPGGGVEEGESEEEAAVREAKEEAGVDVRIVGELGRAVTDIGEWEMRDLWRGYVAEAVGEKGEPQYEEWEKERGFSVEWWSAGEAVEMMKKNKVSDPAAKALQERDLAFLEEFCKKGEKR